MVTLTASGDFKKLDSMLNKLLEFGKLGILDKYGRKGVEALEAATPVDSGRTASGWYYRIEHEANSATLSFFNNNINKGVPIALILQYGHGTRNGGWVEGVDYINPALKPIFDDLLREVWKEVSD